MDRSIHRSYIQTLADSNHAGCELQIADLGLGLTLLDLAASAPKLAVAKRNQMQARKVYDTVVRYLRRLSPTAEQQLRIDEILGLLKRRLESAGEVIP